MLYRLKKELDKNEELKKSLDELSGAASKATAAASQAADRASEAATKAVGTASEAAEKAAKAREAYFEQAAKARETFGASAGAGAEAEAKTDAKAGAETDAKADAKADADAPPPPPPLWEKFMSDVSSLASAVRSKVEGGGSPNPAAGPMDGDTTAVVIRPPSFWEKNFNQDSPFFQRFRSLFGAAGDTAGSIGDISDRVMGETEQAEALRELREIMPDFHMETFLNECGEDLVPKVRWDGMG